MEPTARPTRNIGFVVVAALAFATSSPLARSATGLAPILVAAGRCAVASIAILTFSLPATIRAVRALSPKHRVALPIVGVLLAAHFALFLGGLASTSFPAAVALVSLEPLAVVLAAWFAFGLRPTGLEAAGVIVASAGAVVVASGAGSGEHRMAGDVMVLVAVALFGAYVASARGLRDSMPVMPYAAAVYGVAGLALAPFAIYAQRAPAGLPSAVVPTTWSWVAVVLLGLVPTLIGHTLVQSAARRISPSIVALVSPGETVGSLLIGAAVLGAMPSPREALGTLFVLAGATIAIRGARASA